MRCQSEGKSLLSEMSRLCFQGLKTHLAGSRASVFRRRGCGPGELPRGWPLSNGQDPHLICPASDLSSRPGSHEKDRQVLGVLYASPHFSPQWKVRK